jgi:hypothetical protein
MGKDPDVDIGVPEFSLAAFGGSLPHRFEKLHRDRDQAEAIADLNSPFPVLHEVLTGAAEKHFEHRFASFAFAGRPISKRNNAYLRPGTLASQAATRDTPVIRARVEILSSALANQAKAIAVENSPSHK